MTIVRRTPDLGQMQRNYPGETLCGDSVLIRSTAEHTLVALADGLGHGPDAHRAAGAFVEALLANSGTPSELMQGAHRALSGTRGAVAMILRFNHELQTLDCTGVGNIECLAIAHASIRPVSTPGVVGHNVRRITEASYATLPGDWFALVSDGISLRASFDGYRSLDAQRAAELIVENHSRGNDDASCVVIKLR